VRQERLGHFRGTANTEQRRSMGLGEFNPISSLADGTAIEYVVGGSGQDYIDLQNSTDKSTTSTSTDNIDKSNNVGPINLWLHSLFSEVDMKLNDTLITSSNNTYLEHLSATDPQRKDLK